MFLIVLFLLMFVGVAYYGLSAKILAFFLVGTVGMMGILLNLTTHHSVLKWISCCAIFGASFYGIYLATQTFF